MGDNGFLDKSLPQEDLHIIRICFGLPVMAMVFITILNDGAMTSIACDSVEAGKVPEKWHLPVVCSIASLFGRVACGGSMLMLYMCLSTTELDSFLVKCFKTDPVRLVSDGVHVRFPHCVCGQNTRVLLHASSGCVLGCAAVFATSTLLSWVRPFHDMEPIPGAVIGIMWVYCLVLFIIQNVVKVLAYAAVNHTKFSFGGESAGMKDRSNQASEQPTMNVQEWLARINALEGELQSHEKVTAEAK